MKNIVVILIGVGFIFSCKNPKKELKNGRWYAEIKVYKNKKKVPFSFEIINQKNIVIHNADERLEWKNSVNVKGDSVFIPSPIFNSEIKAVIKGDELFGAYYRYDKKDFILPFYAKFLNTPRPRYRLHQKKYFSVVGKWQTIFGKNTKAIGEFYENGNVITGSFLTETGDYRYLEGAIVNGNILKLSGFDGLHVWCFEAVVNGTQLKGAMYSGKNYKKEFISTKGVEKGYLQDADKMTYLKQGYDKIEFSFPNAKAQGNISLSDQKYKDKVVILQIMGTWCPNCMDETQYLNEVYNKYNKDGLEVIGLAFEYYAKGDINKAKKFVQKSIKYHNSKYDFTIAATNKKEGKNALPQLNKIISYPTSIYIGRDGKVKKIHTGFLGPATKGYNNFIKKNDKFIQLLLEK